MGFYPGGWLVYERVGDTLWKIKIKALEDTNLPGGGVGGGGSEALFDPQRRQPTPGANESQPAFEQRLIFSTAEILSRRGPYIASPKKCEYINHHVARFKLDTLTRGLNYRTNPFTRHYFQYFCSI